MKIALTGASGRLARTVINLLINDPEIESITALDAKPFNFNNNKIKFYQCDVRNPEIGHFFNGCDTVIHLAFIVEQSSGYNRATIDKINVGGTKNVFNAIAASGVKQAIYTSSIAAYGSDPENAGHCLTEETNVRELPEFYYAQNKAVIETWLDGFEAGHRDIQIAILRPSIFFSEKPEQGIFRNLFTRRIVVAVRGMDAPVHITHGDDVAKACVLALKKRAHGKFNVSSDEPLTIAQMAGVLGKRFIALPKIMLVINYLAFRFNLIDIDPIWTLCFSGNGVLVSSKKIRNELGWEPRYKTAAEVIQALSE